MNIEIFRFGRCEVRAHLRQVALDGQNQSIEPLPFDLLVFLIRNRDHVVSKDQLIDQIWKGRHVTDGVIATAILKARRAIGDHGTKPSFIVTSHRRGYRFVAETEITGGHAVVRQDPTIPAQLMAMGDDQKPVTNLFGSRLEKSLGSRHEIAGLLHALMSADHAAAMSLATRLLDPKAARNVVTQAAVHRALGRLHESKGDYQTAQFHFAQAHRLVNSQEAPACLNDLPIEEERGRKSVVDELRSANTSLFNMLDSIPDPIFVKDQDHRWVFLNHDFCKLIGHHRENLLGKSDYDFFPESQADIFWQMDDVVFQSHTENINEESITGPSGTTHIATSKKKIFIDPSREIYLIGTLRFSR